MVPPGTRPFYTKETRSSMRCPEFFALAKTLARKQDTDQVSPPCVKGGQPWNFIAFADRPVYCTSGPVFPFWHVPLVHNYVTVPGRNFTGACISEAISRIIVSSLE